jgi:hypothetical protein
VIGASPAEWSALQAQVEDLGLRNVVRSRFDAGGQGETVRATRASAPSMSLASSAGAPLKTLSPAKHVGRSSAALCRK